MEDVESDKLLAETATPTHKETEKTIVTSGHPADRTARAAKILLTARLTMTQAGKALLAAVRLKRTTRLMTPKLVS